ncbi:MAG: flagellar biosynthesis protein FlhB [Alphaproteobacteria bacterium]
MAEGDDQDESQKTEDPTSKRREEAHKKGQVAFSREVTSFLILFVLGITVAGFAPSMIRNTQLLLMPFITQPESMRTDMQGIGTVLEHVTYSSLMIILLPVVCVMVVVILSSFFQNGIVFSHEPIMPKLNKISPLAGIKRMFSMRSIVEFLKGIIKITIVGVVGFLAVYPDLVHIRQLPNSSAEAMLSYLQDISVKLLIGILIAMFFIALLDLFFQRWQLTKQLRMTKQEIKDEYKQTEGDPQVKQRLRALRMEKARQRMMAAVPQADVVITNPTHFAVALKYDTVTMKAPTVIAKGQDLIAQRIREIAKEHDIPIVEDKPLAQALFKSVEIDEEIQVTHYEAVAKIISYVYQLKGRKF